MFFFLFLAANPKSSDATRVLLFCVCKIMRWLVFLLRHRWHISLTWYLTALSDSIYLFICLNCLHLLVVDKILFFFSKTSTDQRCLSEKQFSGSACVSSLTWASNFGFLAVTYSWCFSPTPHLLVKTEPPWNKAPLKCLVAVVGSIFSYMSATPVLLTTSD